MIKLKKFDETTDVVLCDPATGTELVHEDGRKVSVTMYGAHSAHFKSVKNQQLNKRLKSPNRKITAEQAQENELKLFVDNTVSLNNFDGVDLDDGVDYTQSDAQTLYTNHPWVVDQIDAVITEMGNFISQSTTKSKKG